MPRPKGKRDAIRFTVSLEPQLHAKLLRIAERNDVSLAWAVRRAVVEFADRQDDNKQAELPFLQSSPRDKHEP